VAIVIVCCVLAGLVLLDLVLAAVALWLCSYAWNIVKTSFFGALCVCIFLVVVNTGIIAGAYVAAQWYATGSIQFDLHMLLSPLPPLAAMAIGLVVTWLTVKIVYRTDFRRAALALAIMMVPGVVAVPALTMVAALVLKFTVLETFIVPTGAMATAIHGAHADITCKNCGFPYAVTMSDQLGPNPPPPQEKRAVCPNCSQLHLFTSATAMRSGDRIAVDKTLSPGRWDVTVFRYPEDPKITYVKRLVGLPGETIEIAAGDIFVDGKLLVKDPGTATDLWLPVFDSSFVPASEGDDGPRWKPAGGTSAWERTDDGWTASSADVRAELVYAQPVTDVLAYNGVAMSRYSSDRRYDVRDVKITAAVERISGDGRLGFLWQFGDDRAAALVSATGAVEIVAGTTGSDQQRVNGLMTDAPSDGQEVSFAFRDGQAYVLAGETTVASLAVGYDDVATAREQSGQKAARRIGIFVENCEVSLKRVCLYRDVHYLTMEETMGGVGSPATGQSGDRFELGEGEHFVLGDNSAHSKDSRFWGVVDSQKLIGVARWRSWPPSRWHQFK